ncbi:uncharacterized protein LOC129791330 isoform X2 [Lutzomyia longipalpis]|uniref:uncharacterized protein LOC129791330 isoform X2 n=1 Tax=Lutzomyia longipalpis TaxID=7200 RepID=UPI002483E338|nr:uncharacterized protein LOC129791330 isoform X2 [Lutzomyia longipalpis]XP_055685447.1 uncharacterized protein LOC129791330 isoform X2 [Lutzomyia longipalpis]XP_055685456.1 uncharacterized protein LOC129791330 isoform X2 [Lutzomyia longipalpis]
MVYVGLSRVESLKGLHIIGEFVQPNFSNSAKQAQEVIKVLRNERFIEDQFKDIRTSDKNKVKICYHNIISLHKHFKDIDCDSWYKYFNIVILSETKTTKNFSVPCFKNYKVLYRQDNAIRNIGGLLCYVRDEDNDMVKILTEDVKTDLTKKFSLSLFVIEYQNYHNNFYIITGYKSPKVPFDVFKESFENVSSKIPRYSQIIVIGDFNFNVSSHKTDEKFLNYLNQYGLQNNLDADQSTTKYDSQIDIVFSNIPSNNFTAGIYDSYFSDHRPVYCTVGSIEESESPDETDNVPELPPSEITQILPLTNTSDDKNSVKSKTFSQEIESKPMNTENSNVTNNVENQNWPANILHENGKYLWEVEDISFQNQFVELQHIYRFMDILHATYPDYRKINPTYGFIDYHEGNDKCPVIQPNEKHLQFIISYDRRENFIGHWTLAIYNGNDRINYYDSMNGEILNREAERLLGALHPHLKPLRKFVTFHTVMRQPDNIMCGIFAIANAVSYILGINPCEQKYDIMRMRNHLKLILVEGEILPFPTI